MKKVVELILPDPARSRQMGGQDDSYVFTRYFLMLESFNKDDAHAEADRLLALEGVAKELYEALDVMQGVPYAHGHDCQSLVPGTTTCDCDLRKYVEDAGKALVKYKDLVQP